MHKSQYLLLITLEIALSTASDATLAQKATITEETRVITTYPFSEPNPIPILTRDPRLYPYHSFEGYAQDGVPREWKVIKLENEHIEVFVLPEVGGKVWGAIVKKNGHEFIYRNEVLKFRNIALRGPWTSGGIEFNFGVIGHTPATATPVDYVMRENPDGSVSCIVGAMDLPSRTHWRVEIRLPADRAYFETNVLWYNPTPLAQPYYNWMTAAAFARPDLEMFVPGNAFLEHSGAERAWPTDASGRYLPAYINNTFDSHKSYHVVGELNDFFGGYYHDEDHGFGHWARYEDMPGQKLWLWALSGEGGIWEELLTDTDGQYVEYQAGRLLVQYSPGRDVSPISQVEFDPGAADRWSETWFPLEGIGGLTAASRDGAMHVTRDGGILTVRINAFGDLADTLHVRYEDEDVAALPMSFETLEPVERTLEIPGSGRFTITLRQLGLEYDSNREVRALQRPFATNDSARTSRSTVDRAIFNARELARARRYGEARETYEAALVDDPWNRDVLLGLADLEYRRGYYEIGLTHVNRALQLDTYDAKANFLAGNLYRALGDDVDAREAYGWSARSMAFRSASYLQLAEIDMANARLDEASRYAGLSIDYDRYNIPARQILAMVAREQGEMGAARRIARELLEIDPLHHFVSAEEYLSRRDSVAARLVTESLRGEYPEQIILELVIDYVRRGARWDAQALLRLGVNESTNPLLRVWLAWIENDLRRLNPVPDVPFVFPYRRETIPVLEWAVERSDHWTWRYLLALNLWALDREEEAARHLIIIGNDADLPAFYVARARLLDQLDQRDPETDLRRAAELGRGDRLMQIHLVRYLQENDRWQDALGISGAARSRLTGDFNLDLLHVRSLNNLGRGNDALEILASTHVLPSEHVGGGHRLYEQAHTLAALDAMEQQLWTQARTHLTAALDWPEHLGEGPSYNPEERLTRYLLAMAELALGNETGSRAQLEAVIGSGHETINGSRRDVLNVAALWSLGRLGRFFDADDRSAASLHGLARSMIQSLSDVQGIPATVDQLAMENPEWFADLDGRLLFRALSLATALR